MRIRLTRRSRVLVLVVASLALLLVLGLFVPNLLGRDRSMLTLGADAGTDPPATADPDSLAGTPTPSSSGPGRSVPAETGRKAGDSGKPPSSTAPRPRKVPPPDGTLCGAAFLPEGGQNSTTALAAADQRFRDLDLVRIYYSVPPPWPGPAGTAGRTVVVSFKLDPKQVNAGTYDTALRRWFKTAPRDRDIYWALYHEPEENIEQGEFTAAEFRQAWRRVAGFASRAANPRLRATLILMDWSLEPLSGRRWRDYYPGGDVVDVLAFDVYNDGWKQKPQVYDSAEKELGSVVAVSKATGKPFGLAELGSNQVPDDSTGAGRAAWIRAVTEYAIRHKAVFVSYFDIDYSEQLDYRLRDRPSIAAWREFCDR